MLVMRNVFRNRRRTALTVLSVAVSIFVFAMLMSLPTLVRQILSDPATALRLVVHSKAGFLYPLPYSYFGRIAAVNHVQVVAGESIFMATYRDPRDEVPAIAMDPEHVEELWTDWGISVGAAKAFRSERTTALAGKTLMRRFGWSFGNHVILRGTAVPIDVDLEIAGVLGDRAPGYALIFRRDQLDEALGRPGTVNIFWVRVDRASSIPAVIADIDRTFANSSSETLTESELAMAESRMGEMRLIFEGVKFLAAVVIATIGLVAANTAAMSVRERRHEFAIMRAIGFSSLELIALMIAEGLVIGLCGGGLGCAAAYGGLRLLPYASRSLGIFAYAMFLPRRNAALGLMVAAIIGLASNFIPVLAEMRAEIAAELRAA